MRDSRMPGASRLVTAEELERFPSDDRRYELLEGRLIAMTCGHGEPARILEGRRGPRR